MTLLITLALLAFLAFVFPGIIGWVYLYNALARRINARADAAQCQCRSCNP
jgi:hypothetical protein